MTTDTIVELPWRKRVSIESVLTRSIADRMSLTLWIGLGLGLMAFMVTGMFDSLFDSLTEMDLGDVMEVFLAGSAINSPEGWLSAEMYTLMIPMGIVALVVIDGARSFAGEEQDQSIGMLAANPLSRTRILVEKSFGIIVHVLIVAVLVGLFVWAGSAAFGLGLDASHIWAASLHGALLGIMFGGLTALVSVATGKRVASMMIIGAMAVVFYLIASFFPIIETLADWAQISPWHFYYSSNPLANGVDWTHVGLMAGISAVLYLTAWYVFTKRDLPG